MFIELFKNNGVEYLRLAQSYRAPGSKRSTKKIIYNIGPLTRVTDGQPDFVQRLRDSFKEGQPILSELQPYVEAGQEPEKVETILLPFPVKGENSDGEGILKAFADLILNAYMNELGLAQLFRSIKSKRRIQYDLLGFVKLIVYGRILDPCSKIATVEQNNSYYSPILEEGFNPYNVYDTLDIVHENRINIFKTINKALSSRKEGRETSVIYYDVTNFFFEIEMNDPDILDDDGVVIEEGLRKRGHSKENRPQPIVQMGLFLDKAGIPIGIKTFSGNTIDKVTMVQATSEVVMPMGYERFIYCADRGLCTLGNLAFLVNEGMGYLLSKSIKQSKKEDREWIVDPKGYVEEKNEDGQVVFKYKHATMERTYTDEDGVTTTFKEKVVAFWSLEYYKREQHQMESFSNFLKKLEEETHSFTLSTGQINKLRRFLKDEILDSLDPENDSTEPEEMDNPGEKPKRRRLTQEEKDQKEAEKKATAAHRKAIKESRKKRLMDQLKDSNTARTMIDWEKVNRWRDYAGYYQIVTSEMNMEDKEVIRTYRELTQIENRFRTMKGPLDTRPIYLRDPDHIDGHLILCAVALTLIALIQSKVKRIEPEETSVGKKWFLGLDPGRIQEALNALQVEPMPENYFRFRSRSLDQKGMDLQKILDAHGIVLQSRLYTPGELRSWRGALKVL